MFKEILNTVPHLPGSYQMYDENDKIIYVGKAKDLNKRLSSYFNGRVTGKTAMLVNDIHHFKYIVTLSELESFILELNLIKTHHPKYNILLTDDKSYPYIELIKKPFPKLKIVRYLNIKKNNNKKLFGPFPNSFAARKVVNLINQIYPLKKCDTMPKKVCLYYHIDECLGYCVKDVNPEIITQMENEIISFFNGNNDYIKNKIKIKINQYIENLNYESAKTLKENLNYIEITLKKQHVEISDLINRDVLNYYNSDTHLCIEIFFIRQGKLIGTHHKILPINDDIKELIEQYIALYYENNEIQEEILVPNIVNIELLSNIIKTKFIAPIRGKKKKILDMVKENAKINLNNNLELIYKDEKRTYYANQELMNILKMSKLERIEIFDNSNLFGDYSVSGMVVFKNGLPAKNEYRKFKILLNKNDDYNTMKEVIYRRYYRVLMEKLEKPDLIIIDGGINQINAAKSVLNSLNLNIRVVGIKKDSNHYTNELIDGETNKVITIDKHSDLFHYLTRIQDEVHRYTINYHRTIRNKGAISSVLDEIPGVGTKRRKQLIEHFDSISNIKNAQLSDLKEIVPKQVAENIYNFFNK